ncbi:hypothetical protein GCM10020255_092950 [Rhodococcus baikonurensis]
MFEGKAFAADDCADGLGVGTQRSQNGPVGVGMCAEDAVWIVMFTARQQIQIVTVRGDTRRGLVCWHHLPPLARCALRAW